MVLTNRKFTDLKTDIQEIHDTFPNITERLKSALSSEEIIFDSSISERYSNIWTIKKQNELILSAGDFNF